jgi:predicted secreted Zn-dependent protease
MIIVTASDYLNIRIIFKTMNKDFKYYATTPNQKESLDSQLSSLGYNIISGF